MASDPDVEDPGPSLVAVVHDDRLGRGKLRGYWLVLSDDLVVGGKKYAGTRYVAVLPNLDEQGRRHAHEVASRLIDDKDFELRREEIAAIEIKPPGRFKPGALVLRSNDQEVKILITGTLGTGSKGVPDLLVSLFDRVVPGKVQRT